jgi:hypothetical protein
MNLILFIEKKNVVINIENIIIIIIIKKMREKIYNNFSSLYTHTYTYIYTENNLFDKK